MACWVFVSVWGLSLVVASGGHSSTRCAGPSLSQPLLLRSTGSRRTGSVVVAHGASCSMACGIFPDQGSNPCPLHWQADSQPLRHQGSPWYSFNLNFFIMIKLSMLAPFVFPLLWAVNRYLLQSFLLDWGKSSLCYEQKIFLVCRLTFNLDYDVSCQVELVFICFIMKLNISVFFSCVACAFRVSIRRSSLCHR